MDNKNHEDSNLYDNLPSRKETFEKRSNVKRNIRKRVCAILLVVLLIAFYGVGAFGLNLLGNTKEAMSTAYSPTSSKSKNVSKILKQKKPFSILLLGTDTGNLGRTEKGRTDTMIVMTVNPKTEKITMTSIPRDTAVQISGTDSTCDKINSAYTYGGTSLAVKTVEKTLDIPINFYMLVNMGGLVKVVDDLGGVTVTPPLSFTYEGLTVTKNKKITLNGDQALSYSRMRDDDPQGDYGRQKRQKQIITAIIKKAMSVSSLTKYNKTLNAIEGNLKTDLSYDDLMMIESYYKDAGKHVVSHVLQGSDETIGGLSYQIVSASEKKKVSNQIRHQLGLKKSTHDFEDDSYSGSSSSTTSGNGYGTGTGYGYGYGQRTGTTYGNNNGYGTGTNSYGTNQGTTGYGQPGGNGTGTTGYGTGVGTGTETGTAGYDGY